MTPGRWSARWPRSSPAASNAPATRAAARSPPWSSSWPPRRGIQRRLRPRVRAVAGGAGYPPRTAGHRPRPRRGPRRPDHLGASRARCSSAAPPAAPSRSTPPIEALISAIDHDAAPPAHRTLKPGPPSSHEHSQPGPAAGRESPAPTDSGPPTAPPRSAPTTASSRRFRLPVEQERTPGGPGGAVSGGVRLVALDCLAQFRP